MDGDTTPPGGFSTRLGAGLQHEMSAQALLRRSRRLLWLTLLPLLTLVLLLAAWQARLQWQRVIDDAVSEVRTQGFAFAVLARDAHNHVSDLRYWLQQEFIRADNKTAAPAVVAALQPSLATDGRLIGYSLDGLPHLLRGGMAQLLWLPSKDMPLLPPPAALLQAQNLAGVMELAHQRNPDLLASYVYGAPAQHLVFFPWASSESLLAGGAASPAAADPGAPLKQRYELEVVRAGTPELNPLQQPYWTAPTLDRSGAGWIVSRAAPLYVADEWRGVVGTDIKLATLEQLLHSLPAAPWSAWLVDERGHVLADRQTPWAKPVGPSHSGAQPVAGGDTATPSPTSAHGPMIEQRLPEGVNLATLSNAATTGDRALAAHGQRLIAARISGTPWTLVLAAPDGALLRSLLPQVLPYSLIVLGLLLVWLLGQAALRQRVLTPVLQVLEYLQRLAADPAAPEPQLRRRWQPWVQMVTKTFAALRSSTQGQLRADTLKSAIVDHAQAAVVVADAEGRIVEFNPAAEAMLHCPREQALGQTVRDLLSPARYRDSFDLAVRQMRDGQAEHLLGQRLQRICCRADGSELPVEVVMWMTRVEGASYFTASMTDLTEVRATAEVIERQRDALRQSEKLSAMGSLLAGVAHELNNPLAIVMGRASLLEEKSSGTPLHSDAVRIRDAAERCGRIVRTFLNMARSRPAQHGPVQLNDIVRAAADLLGYTLRSHSIQLDLQLHDNLPPVQADGDQIGQVVLNLIVNAQQALASQATQPTLRRRISLQTGHEGGASGAPTQVWLKVRDSGSGVAQELRDKVFEPFFTTKSEGMGTGVGLSVSRAIVREHGGELALESGADSASTPATSQAAMGACFVLTLPVHTTTPAREASHLQDHSHV